MSASSPPTPKPTLADIVDHLDVLHQLADTTCHLRSKTDELQDQIQTLYSARLLDRSHIVAVQQEEEAKMTKLHAQITTLKHEVIFHVARNQELYCTVHALEKRMKEMEVFFGGGKAEPKIKIEKE